MRPATPIGIFPTRRSAPQSAEEVQAIVRIANEHKGAPLADLARQKSGIWRRRAAHVRHRGAGFAGRMKRILEVNERFGYCLIEPGVGFFDLFNYLQENKIPLWMSVPR